MQATDCGRPSSTTLHGSSRGGMATAFFAWPCGPTGASPDHEDVAVPSGLVIQKQIPEAAPDVSPFVLDLSSNSAGQRQPPSAPLTFSPLWGRFGTVDTGAAPRKCMIRYPNPRDNAGGARLLCGTIAYGGPRVRPFDPELAKNQDAASGSVLPTDVITVSAGDETFVSKKTAGVGQGHLYSRCLAQPV